MSSRQLLTPCSSSYASSRRLSSTRSASSAASSAAMSRDASAPDASSRPSSTMARARGEASRNARRSKRRGRRGARGRARRREADDVSDFRNARRRESVKRPTTPRSAPLRHERARERRLGDDARRRRRERHAPVGLSPPRGGDRGARVPSRRDRSSHRRAHRDDCVGGLSRDLRRRAARASAAPVPPGLARWSASPSPFVRGVSPRLRRRRGRRRGPPTVRPRRHADPLARVDGRPTRRVTHPARYRPSRPPPDRRKRRPRPRPRARPRIPRDASRVLLLASTSPPAVGGRPPSRASPRFQTSPSTRFASPSSPPRTSSNPPTSPRSVSNSATARASNGIVGARTRTTTPPSARSPRALARVVDALHPENDPRASFGCSTASRARERREGRTRRHPRASLVRGGDGGHRALRGRRARRDWWRFARWRLARASSRPSSRRRTWRRCSGPRVG